MMKCWKTLKDLFRGILFPAGTNPISPMLLLTVFLCTFGNSMLMTMAFSFLPKMTKSFGSSERDVGYYVGIIASALYIGRVLSSYFWGWLCDRIGRRTSLITTTIMLLFATCAFGVSRSVAWAFTTRFLQGLVGGVIVALKACVFGLCDETNSSLGMAFLLGGFSVGIITGPALGGFLAFPTEKFPAVFAKGSFFHKYPVFLPVLVNISILCIAVIMIFFNIPESLKRNLSTEKSNLLKKSGTTEGSQNEEESMMTSSLSFAGDESFLLISVKKPCEVCSSSVPSNENGMISHFEVPTERKMPLSCCSLCCNKLKESAFSKLMRMHSVLLSVGLYGLVSFVNTGFDELMPIFADSSYKYGGLNFTTGQIGTAILISAIPVAFVTFLMARLERKFGPKNLLFCTSLILVFILPLFPFIGALQSSQFWYALIPSLILMRLLVATSFFAVNVILNTSVDSKYIGSVNGLGMTVSCIFRAMSPTLLGSLYSSSLKLEAKFGYPFNHFLPFVLNAFVTLIIVYLCSLLPNDNINKNRIENLKESDLSDLEHYDQEVTV